MTSAGQLLQEQRAVVRRHVVEQRGNVLLRHRLEQRFLGILGQVLEDGGGVLAGQHAEDHDLIFEVELGEQVGDVARVAVPQHVAQPREVPRAHDRRQFFGRSCDVADRCDRVVALRSGKLLFHLRKRGPDDVVVVHVRPDGLDRVEPETMNQIEIGR